MNTVNKLMDILPEDPQDWTTEHIEEVIAWQRKTFQNWEKTGSTKTKMKDEDQEELTQQVLKEIMAETPKTVVKFKRRI